MTTTTSMITTASPTALAEGRRLIKGLRHAETAEARAFKRSGAEYDRHCGLDLVLRLEAAANAASRRSSEARDALMHFVLDQFDAGLTEEGDEGASIYSFVGNPRAAFAVAIDGTLLIACRTPDSVRDELVIAMPCDQVELT